jgi:hypothetical protein
MNTTTHALSRPFGIGTRTEIRLDDHRLVTLSLRAGDMLRSEVGLVWATVDGKADDILLDRGDVHRVERDGAMHVSAFGAARLEVYGCGPLRFDWPRSEPARLALARSWDALVVRLRSLRTPVRSQHRPALAA